MARRPQPEVFTQGGTQYAPPQVGAWGTILRLPLRFWPRSTNPINFERLPPADDLASMELAFCERPTGLSEYTLGLAATALSVGYGAPCWRARACVSGLHRPGDSVWSRRGRCAGRRALPRTLPPGLFDSTPPQVGRRSGAPPAALADLCRDVAALLHGERACRRYIRALRLDRECADRLFRGICSHPPEAHLRFTPGAAPARVGAAAQPWSPRGAAGDRCLATLRVPDAGVWGIAVLCT